MHLARNFVVKHHMQVMAFVLPMSTQLDVTELQGRDALRAWRFSVQAIWQQQALYVQRW